MNRMTMPRIGCAAILLLGMLGGCESAPKDPFDDYFASQHYKDFVPTTAEKVAQGTGVLEYKAMQPGRVYVVDLDDLFDVKGFKKPRVIVVSTIDQDVSVRFDPSARQFWVSGREPMRLTKVTAGHEHEMRFAATGERE